MLNYTKFLFCVFGRGRAAERKPRRRRSEAKKATAGTRQSLTEAERGQRHILILCGRLPARRAHLKSLRREQTSDRGFGEPPQAANLSGAGAKPARAVRAGAAEPPRKRARSGEAARS